MTSDIVFSSPLADAMAGFVAFKRMQGYDYSSATRRLRPFDRFLVEQGAEAQLLQPAQLNAYAATTVALSPSTRESRLSAVRQFSRYLHARCPSSAVLPARIFPKAPRRPRFYPLEPEQIRQLMDEAARLRPRHGVRPQCIRFLIGFLYATGLRISEALKLNLGDVDTDTDVVSVREGKFGKDRLVALSESTAAAVLDWLDLRSRHAATGPTAPFLIGRPNRRLTYWQARHAFRVLRRRCGLLDRPPPRLHDLRHNFASHCIARWRAEGKDLASLFPALVNAMGHVTIFDTQVYIHAAADDLLQASVRFGEYTTRSETSP